MKGNSGAVNVDNGNLFDGCSAFMILLENNNIPFRTEGILGRMETNQVSDDKQCKQSTIPRGLQLPLNGWSGTRTADGMNQVTSI